MENWLGGSPLGVAVRLAVLSIVVGIVLAALGLEPFDVFDAIRTLVDRLYAMGFGAVEKGLGYLLTGAVIVVPVWLIGRLLSSGRSKE
jgi:hypothetical protein